MHNKDNKSLKRYMLNRGKDKETDVQWLMANEVEMQRSQ